MKNIIICSDGTGKTGGHGKDTNVFRLYKAIDVNAHQIAVYDDGIGSTGSKWLRTISGIFGFGFGRNIMDLYSFLVRNYDPGDKIYMFGFSRGAATVRALAGMIHQVGLLKSDSELISPGGRIDHIRLTVESYLAMKRYKRSKRHANKIEQYKKYMHDHVSIEMIGAWDTVSALGFPQDSSVLLVGISRITDIISEFVFPHRYFDYQLTPDVKNVYHALALDETRKTFRPILWDETTDKRPVNIEQVWFAGVHGNIGGGYPRTGLSAITLNWIMSKAAQHGITFTEAEWDDIQSDANPHGSLIDPRSGLHLYYRFEQRHVRDLTLKAKEESMLAGNIKIHASVFDRINTYKYAPILPNTFDIIGDSGMNLMTYEVVEDEVRNLKKRANRLLTARKWLYHGIMELFTITLIAAWYMSATSFEYYSDTRTHKGLMAFIPSMFENMVNYLVYTNPIFGAAIVSTYIIVLVSRKVLQLWADRIRLKINWWLLKDFKK
jgi:uncharacterized protein (DUF2235 family)